MKIAILSDTHNNLAYAQLARKKIADAGIRTVIHCGDVIDPGIVDYFGEFRIILVYGNGDYPANWKSVFPGFGMIIFLLNFWNWN